MLERLGKIHPRACYKSVTLLFASRNLHMLHIFPDPRHRCRKCYGNEKEMSQRITTKNEVIAWYY